MVKELLNKLLAEKILLEESHGKLKIHSQNDEIPSELLAEIKARKEELITFLQNSKNDYKVITSVEEKEDYPLSNAQKRLWTLSQFDFASIAYNMPSYSYFETGCDVEALQKAFTHIIHRHESLRTIFITNETGETRQKIQSINNLDTNIQQHNLTSHEDAETYVAEFVQKDTIQKFELETGPLYRVNIFQLSDKKFIFFVNFHHIICDGWSLTILEKELLSYYTVFANNTPISENPLTIQYKEYTHWKQQLAEEESYKKHEKYWLEKFENKEFNYLDLPGHKTHPKLKSYNGLRIESYISEEVTTNFRKLCNEANASLFMGLVALWNALFYKYTASKEFVIGTPIAGRDHADLQNQVGFYVNTLVLKVSVDPEESFRNFLNSVKEETVTAYKHQSYPFDQLVEKLDIQWDMSRNPLFDVMIKLLNIGESDTEFTIKDTEALVYQGEVAARFDLNISFEEVGEGLVFNITYNKDIYDAYYIENMIHHFKQFMVQMLENPNNSIGNISHLHLKETQKIVHEWNDTEHEYTDTKTLVDILEERVLKSPEKVAFIDDTSQITYKQLNENANQIGKLLQQNDAKKESYVCMHTSRSVAMIAGLYGILKTGAAYLPLEPALPLERKAQIAVDLNVQLILTDRKHLKATLDFAATITSEICVICLDDAENELETADNIHLIDNSEISKQSTENLDYAIAPTDEAYVIFTSGSTGKPKGVVVTHKPILNLIDWVNETYKITENDKLLNVASISFDLSVYDIFGITKAGGTVRIASHEELQKPKELAEIIYNESITFWDSAPAALMLILPELLSKKEQKGALRLVFLSGDWVPLTIASDLQQCFPAIEVIALGGATEAVIWSNHYPIKEIKKEWSSIPYGKPIWNAKYYILDEYLHPCAIGVEGDLYIGGAVLAKEYKNDEVLTNAKFIENPFLKNEKMYRTGDRARFLKDGNIEFLGRIDAQVKIRGYRIELDEIKHVIGQFAAVKNVFVTTIGEKNERQLVAYFTAKNDMEIQALKTFIQEKLPAYMMPSFLIPVDEFPTTVNGKLDRKKLPQPFDNIVLEELILPTNTVEHQLAEIWSTVLKTPLDKIGITSNFFEIGGDSLTAMMVISRIKKDMNVNVDYEKIFFSPTINTLADYITSFQLLQEQSSRNVTGDGELIF